MTEARTSLVLGEVSPLPAAYDAWVVGDEPVVVIDISGMANYAKQP